MDYLFGCLKPLIEIADCALEEILPRQARRKKQSIYIYVVHREEGLIWDLTFFIGMLPGYAMTIRGMSLNLLWERRESWSVLSFRRRRLEALKIPDEGKGLRIKIRKSFWPAAVISNARFPTPGR